MTEEEIMGSHAHLALRYEATLDTLTGKGLIDEKLVDGVWEKFYASLNEEKLWASQIIGSYNKIICSYIRWLICADMVLLTELAQQYSDDSPWIRDPKLDA